MDPMGYRHLNDHGIPPALPEEKCLGLAWTGVPSITIPGWSPIGHIGMTFSSQKKRGKLEDFHSKWGGSENHRTQLLWQTYKKLFKMTIEIVDLPIKNGDFP